MIVIPHCLTLMKVSCPDDFEILPTCQLCGSFIPNDLYNTWTARYPEMTFRQQRELCRTHKEADAEAERKSKGYPKIDWTELQSRLRRHKRSVAMVLKNPEQSFFRDRLEVAIKSGKARNVLKQITGQGESDLMSVGYYGVKGMQAM